jgi:hypothetical protein
MDSLARVLYDPVGYYRPWRKVVERLEPAQRAAFNDALIDWYALPGYREPGTDQASWVHRILNHWNVLPQAAYLVACAKWRSQSVSSRSYLQKPPLAQAFMQLGFPEAPALPGLDARSVDAWLYYGGLYISQGLNALLPPWLSARLPLVFMPGERTLPTAILTDDGPFDTSCFWSALTYASSHRELGLTLRG